MTMQIWLPNDIISSEREDQRFLDEMAKNMNPVRQKIMKRLRKQATRAQTCASHSIDMPKFSIDFRENIVSVLEKLGIVDVFSPMSDLSPMLGDGQQAAVKKVNHVVKFDVDDEWVTGSAVTIPEIQLYVIWDHIFQQKNF